VRRGVPWREGGGPLFVVPGGGTLLLPVHTGEVVPVEGTPALEVRALAWMIVECCTGPAGEELGEEVRSIFQSQSNAKRRLLSSRAVGGEHTGVSQVGEVCGGGVVFLQERWVSREDSSNKSNLIAADCRPLEEGVLGEVLLRDPLVAIKGRVVLLLKPQVFGAEKKLVRVDEQDGAQVREGQLGEVVGLLLVRVLVLCVCQLERWREGEGRGAGEERRSEGTHRGLLILAVSLLVAGVEFEVASLRNRRRRRRRSMSRAGDEVRTCLWR
jgi:hypothetical protein